MFFLNKFLMYCKQNTIKISFSNKMITQTKLNQMVAREIIKIRENNFKKYFV